MEDRVLFAGIGVGMRTDGVEVAVDRVGVALLCPLEDHVLQEMRDAGHLGRLIPRPGLDEEPHGHRAVVGVRFADDLQAIGQLGMMKLQE